MKQISKLSIIVLLASQTVLAVDFNEIIVENNKVQQNLHAQIKQTVSDSKMAALQVNSNEKYIADSAAANVIQVKTKKSLLTFEKEKKHSKASALQNDKRLAQEFKDLE